MNRILSALPTLCIVALITTGEITAFNPAVMAWLALGLTLFLAAVMWKKVRVGAASMVDWGMGAYVALCAVGYGLWPGGLGRFIAAQPVAVLYCTLFALIALPPLFGAPMFTEHFARKQTPEAVRQTNVYHDINRNMTLVWAGIFAACAVSGFMPHLFSPPNGPVPSFVFYGLIPMIILLGFGLPFTKKYPFYYQRKMGIDPDSLQVALPGESAPDSQSPIETAAAASLPASSAKESEMSDKPKIVAINGSPHGGIGNTSLMIEMLRPTLRTEGVDLEVITLHDKQIDYCTGCALCLEKGKCWIPDDHRGIVKKLLAADGVILASPVYFLQVTAQMKTFLDRSLAWGHKPRGTFKPGLSISVAAAFYEEETANYLAKLLKVYGAYPVGTFTAMATSPGGFLGKEAVEARAQGLARDLAQAIKEKRRYPVTSDYLFIHQLMGWLVNSHQDEVMKDDFQYWQEKGFFGDFEKFVGQKWEPVAANPEARKAWIEQLIATRKARAAGQTSPPRPQPEATSASPAGPQAATTCLELLKMMPLGFNPEAAGDLSATIQFEISGAEDFTGHLSIADGKCVFNEGPADSPDLVVQTPADVWLDISQGRLDGQAAFMGGKYKTQGDITILMRLNQLFSNRP